MNFPTWPAQMVRDTVIVALRAASDPLTASDLVEHMPHKVWINGSRRFDVQPFPEQIYQHLVALEKRGIVARVRAATGRRVFWHLTARGRAADEIAELRELVDLDAAPGCATPAARHAVSAPHAELIREASKIAMRHHVDTARQMERYAEELLLRARAHRVEVEQERDRIEREW